MFLKGLLMQLCDCALVEMGTTLLLSNVLSLTLQAEHAEPPLHFCAILCTSRLHTHHTTHHPSPGSPTPKLHLQLADGSPGITGSYISTSISSCTSYHNHSFRQDGYNVTYPFDATSPAVGIQFYGAIRNVCDGYGVVTGWAVGEQFGAADVYPGWVYGCLAEGLGWGWLSFEGGEEGEDD